MADNFSNSNGNSLAEPLTGAALKSIQEALLGLRFGQVLLVVHEGAIVQIERTERRRLGKTGEVA